MGALAEWTKGQIMFYGGIALTAFSVLMVFLLVIIFSAKKRKMVRKLSEKY